MGQNTTRSSLTTSQIINPAPEEIDNYQHKRTQIVNEIIETEKTYVNCLTVLNEKWEKPLRDSLKNGNPILSEQDIKTIFSIAEGLLCLHQLMLKALCNRQEQWSKEQIIGDIFLQNGNALKLYAEYVNQYNNGIVLLNKRQKEKAFDKFLKDNGGLMALSSLLIQPVQRIPRYQMLLTDLVKNTWTTHDDYTRLSVALGMIIEAAIFVNEQKRRSECLERILEIQNTLNEKSTLPLSKYSFYEAHRTIVLEGDVLKQKADGLKKHPIGFCIMSDKLLLWDKRRGKVYMLADLKDMVATPNQQEFSISISNGRKNVTLEFPSEEARDRWYTTFKETKDQEQNVTLGLLTEDDVSHQFALRQVSPRGTGKATQNAIKKLRPSDSLAESMSEPPPRLPLPNDLPETDRKRIFSDSLPSTSTHPARFHSYSLSEGTVARSSLSEEDPLQRPPLNSPFNPTDITTPPSRPPPGIPPALEIPPRSPPPPPPTDATPQDRSDNAVKGTEQIGNPRKEGTQPLVALGNGVFDGNSTPGAITGGTGRADAAAVVSTRAAVPATASQPKAYPRHGVPLPGMIPNKVVPKEDELGAQRYTPITPPIPTTLPPPLEIPQLEPQPKLQTEQPRQSNRPVEEKQTKSSLYKSTTTPTESNPLLEPSKYSTSISNTSTNPKAVLIPKEPPEEKSSTCRCSCNIL